MCHSSDPQDVPLSWVHLKWVCRLYSHNCIRDYFPRQKLLSQRTKSHLVWILCPPRAQYCCLILVFCPVVNPVWASPVYLFVFCWSVSFAFKHQHCAARSQSWDSPLPVWQIPVVDCMWFCLPFVLTLCHYYYQSLSRRRWMKKMRCWVRLKWNRPHQLSQSQPLWSHQLRENVDVLQRTSRRVSVQSAPSVTGCKSFAV